MISNQDRSGYIGASDTSYVVGSWKTKTFEKWWREKQGFQRKHFQNKYTLAGTNYEHKIIDALNVDGMVKDKQIIIGRLRVNLDGNTSDKIYEVKTYKHEKGFKVPKKYNIQVQVEMYASKIYKACIVAYGLIGEYNNYYIDIDKNRLSFHEIEYDQDFIKNVYLPKLNYLEKCIENGKFPSLCDFERSA